MATTEQFSLRWNNFHSNLTSGFHELLEAADMVDVTLAVDGHFLQAHKIVLSICSPFFKQMFKVNPCKHPVVILKDIGHDNMKDILEFMYMGEVSVLRENLTQFLRTAELLQVKGLTGDDPVSIVLILFCTFCDYDKNSVLTKIIFLMSEHDYKGKVLCEFKGHLLQSSALYRTISLLVVSCSV